MRHDAAANDDVGIGIDGLVDGRGDQPQRPRRVRREQQLDGARKRHPSRASPTRSTRRRSAAEAEERSSRQRLSLATSERADVAGRGRRVQQPEHGREQHRQLQGTRATTRPRCRRDAARVFAPKAAASGLHRVGERRRKACAQLSDIKSAIREEAGWAIFGKFAGALACVLVPCAVLAQEPPAAGGGQEAAAAAAAGRRSRKSGRTIASSPRTRSRTTASSPSTASRTASTTRSRRTSSARSSSGSARSPRPRSAPATAARPPATAS